MSSHSAPVQPTSLAPLKNVSGFLQLVTKLQHRGPHLPNLGVMYGHSGLGKSYASIYAENKTRAVRVEVGESWNRKSFVTAILLECGEAHPRGTTADMVREAIVRLADEPMRPLIVDEADKLVDKGLIEILREISESSQVPVLLIGEERLPQKLAAFERVHNRVLDWYGALACDLEDARLLAKIFLPNATIAADLLETVRVKAEGRARRIVVTLSGMNEWARNKGVKAIDAAAWNGLVFTGEAPRARSGRLSSLSLGSRA